MEMRRVRGCALAHSPCDVFADAAAVDAAAPPPPTPRATHGHTAAAHTTPTPTHTHTMDYDEEQRNELEALEAIFGEDFERQFTECAALPQTQPAPTRCSTQHQLMCTCVSCAPSCPSLPLQFTARMLLARSSCCLFRMPMASTITSPSA